MKIKLVEVANPHTLQCFSYLTSLKDVLTAQEKWDLMDLSDKIDEVTEKRQKLSVELYKKHKAEEKDGQLVLPKDADTEAVNKGIEEIDNLEIDFPEPLELSAGVVDSLSVMHMRALRKIITVKREVR